MGHDDDARRVAIAKQVDLRRSGALGCWGRLKGLFLGATIGHGYKAWMALLYIVGFIGVGSLVFDYAQSIDGVMIPAQESVDLGAKHYPIFHPIMYSADVFLPIVNFHQEDFWLPNGEHDFGWCVLIYLWFHIAAGWVLTTVFVVGLTGIVKQD